MSRPETWDMLTRGEKALYYVLLKPGSWIIRATFGTYDAWERWRSR